MSLEVDFKGVESGGGRVRVPEGDYRAKVTGVKAGSSKSSGNPMLTWEFTGTRGKLKGKKVKDYTTLTSDSLWKLKGLLEALGLKVPQKKINLAPLLKKAIGKELGLTIVDEEYENKMSSKIADYLTVEALEETSEEDDTSDDEDVDDEDDEDEPEDEAPKKKKSKKSKKDSDDEDEIEDLDLDDL